MVWMEQDGRTPLLTSTGVSSLSCSAESTSSAPSSTKIRPAYPVRERVEYGEPQTKRYENANHQKNKTLRLRE